MQDNNNNTNFPQGGHNQNYGQQQHPQQQSNQGQRDYRYDHEGEKLINDPAALTIGIISLVLYFIGCFCYGILSILTLVGSIIALVMANKALKVHQANPEIYSRNTYKSVNAGKIIGLIGTILSGITVLVWIIIAIFFGAFFAQALDGDFNLDDFENNDYPAYDDYDMDEDTYDTSDDDWQYQEDDQDSLNNNTEKTIEIEEVEVEQDTL